MGANMGKKKGDVNSPHFFVTWSLFQKKIFLESGKRKISCICRWQSREVKNRNLCTKKVNWFVKSQSTLELKWMSNLSFALKKNFRWEKISFVKRPHQKCRPKKKDSSKKKCRQNVGAKIKAPTSKMWACQKKMGKAHFKDKSFGRSQF